MEESERAYGLTLPYGVPVLFAYLVDPPPLGMYMPLSSHRGRKLRHLKEHSQN